MAEGTKAGATGSDAAAAARESAAEALDNAANGGATPISAARRTKAEKAEKAEKEKNEKGELAASGEGEDESPSEAGKQGAEQEEAKPVRTAADIVAENAAKKAEEDAAAKAAAGKTGGTATKTAAKPAAKTAAPTTATAKKTAVPAKPASKPVEPAGKGRAALDAAGKGLTRARNLLASIIWLAAVLCAAVLALGALFTALKQTNETNEIVKWVLARGHDLVGPFDDLFKLKTAKNTLLVNWGIAALAYLVVGKIAERIIRP